jgi:hypothetical protein
MSIVFLMALGLGIFVALFLSRSISVTTQSVLEQTLAIAGGTWLARRLKFRATMNSET